MRYPYWQYKIIAEEKAKNKAKRIEELSKLTTLKSLTSCQIDFYKSNSSMKAYVGIRLNDDELEEFIGKKVSEVDFYKISCAIKKARALDNYYIAPHSDYRDGTREVYYELTNIAKKYLKQ